MEQHPQPRPHSPDDSAVGRDRLTTVIGKRHHQIMQLLAPVRPVDLGSGPFCPTSSSSRSRFSQLTWGTHDTSGMANSTTLKRRCVLACSTHHKHTDHCFPSSELSSAEDKQAVGYDCGGPDVGPPSSQGIVGPGVVQGEALPVLLDPASSSPPWSSS